MNAVALPNSSKWAGLLDAEDEANALVNVSLRRISELQKAIDLNPNGENVANFEFELTRLRAKLGEQQAKHQSRAFLNSRVRNWLASLPENVTFAACKPIKLRLAKDETLAAAVERQRQRITAIRQEIARVQSAPPPIVEVKQRAREYIDALQARGRPQITSTAERFEIAFVNPQAFSAMPDLNAILAWLDPAALEKRLTAEIDSWPKPELALSAKDKTDRLALLGMELFQTEREEEACVEQSEVSGPILQRRLEADPAAILGVIVGKAKGASALHDYRSPQGGSSR